MTSQVVGRYQAIYDDIRKTASTIQKENAYKDLSAAFSHWYLESFYNISPDEMGEVITDGFDDNGIDAAIIQDKELKLFQFKFPEKSNIDKCISQDTILKFRAGYDKLFSQQEPKAANDQFMSVWRSIKEESIHSIEFIIVSFTDGLSEQAKSVLDTYISDIKNSTGNTINVKVVDKKTICDQYDSLNREINIELSLSYKHLHPSYGIEPTVQSWQGFTSARSLVEACEPHMAVIFDENIRHYEGDNPVNIGIIKTASNAEEAENFFFFHNGVVFICDSCANSTGNLTATLKGAAIVNGCQTVTSLHETKKKGELHDDVHIPIRIIQTKSHQIRTQITEYLNSQTKIKDSYFLANHHRIKQLQDDLLKEDIFLERLVNEYKHKKNHNLIKNYSKENRLNLEKAVQLHVAYSNNERASVAKSQKGDLFNKAIIEDLIADISADRVIEAKNQYRMVANLITLYRKCRRASEPNPDFLSYINITAKDPEEHANYMNEYTFVNSADMLLLNIMANLNSIYKDDRTRLIESVRIAKESVDEYDSPTPSAATKNRKVFASAQAKCSELIKEKASGS